MIVVSGLLATWTSATADEFAGVDPARLAKGVQILAEKWTLPIVVYYGATDDFAETSDRAGASPPTLKPVSPESLDDPWRPCAYGAAGLPGVLRYGSAYACIPGAVARRRD